MYLTKLLSDDFVLEEGVTLEALHVLSKDHINRLVPAIGDNALIEAHIRGLKIGVSSTAEPLVSLIRCSYNRYLLNKYFFFTCVCFQFALFPNSFQSDKLIMLYK